ncbi:PREDICTED: glutathione S-transferase T3-like [Brassica oleracea var. oleracea]|uniref:glutathione S-transferase T3-like n=1 Tax=Brassica oleracea var. oleracea TaxID=109376 RepID=UPI0006A7525F|nr:PREDICTED: glutathione S-transferase T3-like [Brassica oleracea var. oleracea]
MDPFSQNSPEFVNLLASQSSQTIDLESPEIPRFSSQSSEDPKPVEKRKWTPKEDIILISAWLNTSKDPIVSNEQKTGAFWKRIEEYFNSSPQLSGLPPRERGGRGNEQVCKFVGCYEAAVKEKASG